MDNIVFVVNCDFSEHDASDDLQKLVDRIREEIAMLKPDPDVYFFSALYNLFSSLEDKLSDKERLRYDYWKADRELIELSNRNSARFEAAFYERLARTHYTLLLRNHIERLGVILSGIGDWIGLNRDVLTNDSDSAAGILKKIETHQNPQSLCDYLSVAGSIERTIGTFPMAASYLRRALALARSLNSASWLGLWANVNGRFLGSFC